MTGQEVFKRAMRLLGYTDAAGEIDSARYAELHKRALATVEQLTGELSLAESGELAAPLGSLREELPLSEETARLVMPYGVAMWLAAAQGDGDRQQLFASLYDQRRASVRHGYERRCDTLPREV